jgi:hypothetical protein
MEADCSIATRLSDGLVFDPRNLLSFWPSDLSKGIDSQVSFSFPHGSIQIVTSSAYSSRWYVQLSNFQTFFCKLIVHVLLCFREIGLGCMYMSSCTSCQMEHLITVEEHVNIPIVW